MHRRQETLSNSKNLAQGQAHSQPSRLRRWIYPLLLGVIYALWLGYMLIFNRWHLFQEFWSVPVTMALGSFVAGATPQGGATVAFPVFTKVLRIPSTDARTFGLMIQAIGMTMAAVIILVRRVKILPRVIWWVSLGGAVGITVGAYFLAIPAPYPKILFTFVATSFGVALALSRWVLQWQPRDDIPGWGAPHQVIFFVFGIFGGAFAANTGSGTDMLCFIVLTLAFGINEKVSTPTTVIIMAINSIIGSLIYGVALQNIGIAWNYWLVALPVVILGAPLGAFVLSLIKRDHLIIFLLSLIGLELVTTIWLIPFTAMMSLVTAAAIAVCLVWFAAMLYFRHKSDRSQVFSSTN